MDDDEVCVGELCFARPYSSYVPPAFYRRFPGREYRWKISAKLQTDSALSLKMQRAFGFPSCLGLGNDAKWRWQWHPVSFILGMKMETEWSSSRQCPDSAKTTPFARLKVMSPLCGKLALRPVVEFYPAPSVSITRSFDVGTATIRAGLQLNCSSEASRFKVHLDWHPTKTIKTVIQADQESLSMNYSKRFTLSQNCTIVATGLAEVAGGISRTTSSLPVRVKLECIRITQMIGTRARRRSPAPLSRYLKAASRIGSRDVISVVPGHWIDPGYENGAPGEREFNLEVVNVLEKQLRQNDWEVLRPDRDAPNLSWEEYLNWISKRALKGTPVLEIHGQGSTADYRGLVLGVIGDENSPLSKELAKEFGVFDMDWTGLAIPRRGGVILESFNSDEVLQMAPWHRTWAVRRLASRILRCIERASSENRAARGIRVYDENSASVTAQRDVIVTANSGVLFLIEAGDKRGSAFSTNPAELPTRKLKFIPWIVPAAFHIEGMPKKRMRILHFEELNKLFLR